MFVVEAFEIDFVVAFHLVDDFHIDDIMAAIDVFVIIDDLIQADLITEPFVLFDFGNGNSIHGVFL